MPELTRSPLWRSDNLRKYLIAAVAALTVVALTATAVAQAPEATLKMKLTPKKAGTKAKPKNGKITLNVANSNPQRTLSELTITQPSTVKVSTKGLARCEESVLETQGPTACPRASRVGKGVAHALLGVNTAAPTPLTFDVNAVVTGPRNIGFHLHGRELPGLNLLSEGTLSGRKLRIVVPAQAQQPSPGTWAGLVSIESTLSGKKGKNYLVSTTGCKKRKHAFSTTLTFVDNGVSEPGDVDADASAACSK
jgi:hypothetical protein